MILVLAATAPEVAWASGGEAIGVGPVEAAVSTTRLVIDRRPDAVLHVGLAGARRAAGVPLGSVVLGTRSRYCDLSAALPGLVMTAEPDPDLLRRARAALPAALALEIGTSAAVGGSSGSPVEAMEGFAVLRACQEVGVPALELRVVSNEIEEDDRTRWDFAGALAVLADTGAPLLAALQR